MNARCALCCREKPLCKSHVVPEFAYKPAYDKKHRLVEYDPVSQQRTGLPQKGLYCRLLCHDCERLVNDRYEKPFQTYWHNGDVLALLETEELVILDGIDYASFKLFHLSVLYRAHASALPNFAVVQLGPHAETIRQMVLSGDPGEPAQYPIFCSAICAKNGQILHAFVGPGHSIELAGAEGYYFTFCGCQWHYMIAHHEIPELKNVFLKPNGTLPIIKEYPLALRYYSTLREPRRPPGQLGRYPAESKRDHMDGYTIRLATHDDLLQIRTWLQQEHNDGIDGSFFCNYKLIEDGQQSGSLTALVRDSDALPVAFCLGDNIDILAVKADCRRQGLGRRLAQYFIDAARQRDVIGLYGECAPPTSKPFWKSMGFISVPSPSGDDNENWVACPLPHENDLPDEPRYTIAIALEDTECQMQPVFQCDAVGVDGRYVLARDFVQYVPDPDRQLEIRCNGDPIFSKKNKYVSEVGGERNRPWVRVRELNA